MLQLSWYRLNMKRRYYVVTFLALCLRSRPMYMYTYTLRSSDYEALVPCACNKLIKMLLNLSPSSGVARPKRAD